MPVIVGRCQILSDCQHLFHVTWSLLLVILFCVCIPHTGPPLPKLLLAWPQHQGREICLQHLLNIAWCDGMHTFVAHGYALLLEGILPPDRYCLFIGVYWQPWTVFCKAMVTISCPSSCPRYFCPIPLYSVRGTYFSKCLPKSLWGPFSEGGTSVWQCLVSTTYRAVMKNIKHGAFFNSWHWEQNSVLVASVEAVIVIKTCCDIM